VDLQQARLQANTSDALRKASVATEDLQRFLALLWTYEHKKGIQLFDELAKDPSTAAPILNELLLLGSNHDDPQLHTPHGLLTVHAARNLLVLTRPPGGLGLLRFLVLYNFSLRKRPLTPAQAEANARVTPSGSLARMQAAYHDAIHARNGDRGAAILTRCAIDLGLGAAAHLAVRTALDDLGRLGHNLALAAAYVDTAFVLTLPRGLVALANLAHLQANALQGVSPADIPEREASGGGPTGVEHLEALVEAGDFDEVEPVLEAFCMHGRAEVAYGPLLIAASADPGFLGHTLSLIHAARLASRHLTPSESAWLLWKLYRTAVSRFGYPQFLELGEPETTDREAILSALESSLRHKSPPAESTVRQALEAGIPLEEILARVVDFYGQWTVGEKEHTISYLSAALHTAKFLGAKRALLPLAIALSKLPF